MVIHVMVCAILGLPCGGLDTWHRTGTTKHPTAFTINYYSLSLLRPPPPPPSQTTFEATRVVVSHSFPRCLQQHQLEHYQFDPCGDYINLQHESKLSICQLQQHWARCCNRKECRKIAAVEADCTFFGKFCHQPTLKRIYRSSLLSLASLESLELLLALACPSPRKTSRLLRRRLLLVAAATPTTPRNKRILMTQVVSSRTADSTRHSMAWPIRLKAPYCQTVATHWVRPPPILH